MWRIVQSFKCYVAKLLCDRWIVRICVQCTKALNQSICLCICVLCTVENRSHWTTHKSDIADSYKSLIDINSTNSQFNSTDWNYFRKLIDEKIFILVICAICCVAWECKQYKKSIIDFGLIFCFSGILWFMWHTSPVRFNLSITL